MIFGRQIKFKLIWQSAILLFIAAAFLQPKSTEAFNIIQYKDVLSDSGPTESSNHSLSFILNTDVSPGGIFEITPPPGFSVKSLDPDTFAERNVEMVVNGVPRTSGVVASPGVDQVEITPGSPGLFRYTLAPNSGITSGSQVKILIGNQTGTAIGPIDTFSTSTGTTTSAGDTEPVNNSAVLGVHKVGLEVYDGGLVAKTEFVIFLNEKVNIVNVDTTEEIPPFRFNGAPTSTATTTASNTISATTPNVEMSLETDELAICKYDTVPGTDFNSMPFTFESSGQIVHSQIVPISPQTTYEYYIRCVDDEGNFNTDDFVIIFIVGDIPSGDVNEEGTTDGDGSGTGNSGTGTGDNAGNNDGSGSGSGSDPGNSSGGSGGGGGGGSGGGSGSTGGGGFESTDAPYQSGDGRVIVSGTAYPNSKVTTLVDGKLFKTTTANSSGIYSVTLDDIARGPYTFGVYAEGPNDVQSSTFSTSFTVTGARTSALTNINIPPSISIDPDPVDPGQTVTASGYALPDSTVTIQNSKKNSSIIKTIEVTADGSGRWSTPIDTSNFSIGTYQIRAKSEQTDGDVTNFSDYTYYGVGQNAESPLNGDLSRDGRVNLTDFSILLFWWNTDGGDSSPPADMNADGRVSLTDFSILLFQWTG